MRCLYAFGAVAPGEDGDVADQCRCCRDEGCHPVAPATADPRGVAKPVTGPLCRWSRVPSGAGGTQNVK